VSRFLDRLGRRAARHHWWFIAAWFVVAVLVAVLAKGLDGHTTDNLRIPGTQSQQALDLLEARFPEQSGGTATVVFRAPDGITNPSVQPAITAAVHNLEQIPHVTSVTDPYGPLGAAIISKSGDIALVTAQYDVPAQQLSRDAYDQLQDAVAPATKAGVDVAFGGAVVDYADQPPQGNSDLIGLLAAVVILLFAFGSVIAMGLPILTALFGLGVGISVITVVAAFTDIGTLAPVLATMIGLGVGIDYSLFIVTRYRENLAKGMTLPDAIGHSVGTAGMAVLFAGSTVVIAICGLAISGIDYVARLGYTSAIVVAVMMTAAVTLLPALIGLAGRSIDRFKVPSLVPRHGSLHHSELGLPAPPKPTFWERWANNVARRAWPFAIGSVIVLLVLAYPLLSMRLGQTDDGNLPRSTTQRQAYDLISQGFGPGTNGPLLVVVSLDPARGAQAVDDIVSTIKSTRGVAAVLPPQFSSDRSVAAVTVFPTTAPDSAQTASLVSAVRSKLPAVTRGTGAQAYVGGVTASYIDIGDRITDRLPYFIGAVVLLSFILLLLVFHSVLVPLTAAAMNLLSVGAAYGAIVAVFQWGWFKGVIGLENTVPIVSFIPMMMFAVLFGLSMDYQVFLLTRIREEYDRSHDSRQAVVRGLSRTARVITSAALIMIFVFGAFVANLNAEVKMFGLGLAFAVLVDATIVRMVLVPSIMEILGDANWWFPKWLSWLPRLDIEGSPAPPTPAPEPEVPELVTADRS
jgi:RND superfamily putative drug exporter